jgi:hypothetical protein
VRALKEIIISRMTDKDGWIKYSERKYKGGMPIKAFMRRTNKLLQVLKAIYPGDVFRVEDDTGKLINFRGSKPVINQGDMFWLKVQILKINGITDIVFCKKPLCIQPVIINNSGVGKPIYCLTHRHQYRRQENN